MSGRVIVAVAGAREDVARVQALLDAVMPVGECRAVGFNPEHVWMGSTEEEDQLVPPVLAYWVPEGFADPQLLGWTARRLQTLESSVRKRLYRARKRAS